MSTSAHYTLLNKLGRGGSGTVYKAENTQTGRIVALKKLHNSGDLPRFKNEARIQANLDHPHIAVLYDFIYDKSSPTIIMEYVEGVTLQTLINQSKNISRASKEKIFLQILDAVDYLHQRNIIHRDLKPANIKIDSAGNVKLIDFGISKGLSSPQLTQEGHIVGTITYASPERLNGKNLPQSDIWSLGIILYELMTFTPFFRHGNTASQLAQIQDKSYVIQKLNDYTGPYASIIKKCLQHNPKNRYPTAGELKQDFNPHTDHKPAAKLATLKTPRKLAWIPVAILLLIGGIYLYPKKTIPVKELIDPREITFDLYPTDATITIDNGHKMIKHNESLSQEKGTQLQGVLSAEGYRSKHIIINYDTYRTHQTVRYYLEK